MYKVIKEWLNYVNDLFPKPKYVTDAENKERVQDSLSKIMVLDRNCGGNPSSSEINSSNAIRTGKFSTQKDHDNLRARVLGYQN